MQVLPHHAAPLAAMRIAQHRLASMSLDGLSPAVRHEYLEAIQSDLARIHDEISSEYFDLHQWWPGAQEQPASSLCN